MWELIIPGLFLLIAIVILLCVILTKARLEQHKEPGPILKHILRSLRKQEKKVSLNEYQVGMVLSFLSGVLIFLKSIQVLALESYGFVSLVIAVFILVGCIIAYRGFMPLGVLIIFFTSLYAQMIGVYHLRFLVLFSLIGSVLMLYALGKRKEGRENNGEENN